MISQNQEKTDDWQNIFPMIGSNLFRHLAEQCPDVLVIGDKTRQQDETACCLISSDCVIFY